MALLPDQPTVADVLEFESWPEEQRKVAERVLGKKFDDVRQQYETRAKMWRDW